jgi:hypothetical protein
MVEHRSETVKSNIESIIYKQAIINLEEDFANGYMFAELLNKHKQITNFKEYKNDNDQETTFNNLKLLEKALRDLNIKVEHKKMDEVANKRKGIAAQFLYHIKMKLSKKEINFESLMLKKSKIYLFLKNNFLKIR